MTSNTIAGYDSAAVRDLFTSAAEIARDLLEVVDQQVLLTLAQALAEGRKGEDSARRSRALEPKVLAEHLYVFSYGLQMRGYLGAEVPEAHGNSRPHCLQRIGLARATKPQEELMRRSVLVTGAGSGIGRATVR
ncbi:MAG: hypothetical protein WDO18_17555 [Acidobacteriota bacterium]